MPLHALSTLSVDQCELCHGTHFREVASRDRDGMPLRTVICDDCGLVFSNPRPASSQIDSFYRDSYRMTYKQAWKPRLKHTYRAGKVAQERLAYLLPLLAPGCRVLDFGSGGGELVFILRGLGFDAQGIEPNIGYAEYSRDVLDLPVQIGGFAEADVKPRSVDVVTLFHVAEHLEHPVEAITRVAEWLREGGQLLVEVPNIESRCIWPSSRYHQAHLYHFNAATLAQAGRRAGLRVVTTFTSEDGGNVMAVFERAEELEAAVPTPLPGNAERITRLLQHHTRLTHAFTVHPYVRPLHKLRRQLKEGKTISRFTDGKALLEDLVREIEGSSVPVMKWKAREERELSV